MVSTVWLWRSFWLVSPLNPGGALDAQTVLTAGVHEFTHALVNYINGSLEENNYAIPIWLNEGLAGYESGQMTPEWRAALAQRVADGVIPSITDDLTPPDRWAQVKGLPYSVTLVEYLIETSDSLTDFMKCLPGQQLDASEVTNAL